MSFEKDKNFQYNTSAEQKRNSKNAAKIYRFGTPKLRDMLREKCRIRVKEARQQGFSENRPGCVEPQKIDLQNILRQELSELEYDISLQEEIYEELLTELTEWYIGQLESEENYLVKVAESQELICPVCQMANIVVFQSNEGYFNYRCKCTANFNYANNSESLRQKLFHHIDEHEHECLTKLLFYVNPLTKQLESMCDNCYYFCTF